jgi:serine/threonine protein kinase
MFNRPFEIGNYLIKDEFDKGAFSSVHEAVNTITNEECCVKIMENSKRDRHLIANEIQILRCLNHPNIVGFKDFYETENHFFLFQEFCHGKNLLHILRETKKFHERIAKKVFRQLMEAINYLQQKGISHLDIKLENILCSSDFQIKLIDFGFATSETDLLNSFWGSYHYAAPEVLSHRPYNGMAADMWSCGVVLFTILNGKLPFLEKSNEKLKKLVQKGKYLISTYVSASASNLIKLLLEKKPEKRILAKDVLKHKWLDDSINKNRTGPKKRFLQGFFDLF